MFVWKYFYQLRFKLGEIFNCIHELFKTCEVMWTFWTIWALLSTDLFCLLCSFIVIYRHRLLCANSSCLTLSYYIRFFWKVCFASEEHLFLTHWWSLIWLASSIHFSIQTNEAQSSHVLFLSASVTDFLLSLTHWSSPVVACWTLCSLFDDSCPADGNMLHFDFLSAGYRYISVVNAAQR